MYNLPQSSHLENYSKLSWKKMIRQSIYSFWTQSLIAEAQTKSTLVNCDLSSLAVGVTHTVWESAANNLHDVRRSITKVRMMTGVYMLQSTKARFNQYSVEETCPLCRLGPEDLSHVLLRCPALADVREASLVNIRDFVARKLGQHSWSSWSKSELVAILVDSHNLKSLSSMPVDKAVLSQLEALSRRYCFQLHTKRLQLYRKLSN